jgi:hypothetical protein
MSQQNVEVVRRAFNAYLSGNYETRSPPITPRSSST